VPIIIEHVTLNKFNLLLKIILENRITVQLFTKTIKTESIYKSNYDAKLEGLVGERPSGLIKKGSTLRGNGGSTRTLRVNPLTKVENALQERIS
jgi:hypothetical protein